ncbi:efflux RND transporter periplasmic adaptor subunit, partial [Rugamonas sp. FT82W]
APVSRPAAADGALLSATGYVIARRQATISAKVSGRLTELHVEEGQHVLSGALIARLDDANSRALLAQTEAQLALSRSALADLAPIYQRAQTQLAEGLIAQEALDNAKANYDQAQATVGVAQANVAIARQNQDDTVVRAPFSGVVTVKAAQPGEIVAPLSAGAGFTRTGIATIVDMDSLEVEVEVSENFISRVHPGQPCSVKLNAYPDWDIPARVIAAIPTADRSKATVRVRVALESKDERILPEMGVRVAFLDKPLAAKGQP